MTSGEPAAPGRPVEIELWSNRTLIHPLSRALVDRLVSTPITPNAVSLSGVAVATAAAAAYVALPWPVSAVVGLSFHILWHVLDGADGDLARRTGRASASGELVDGICDYAGRAILYIALAAFLARQIGWTAWPLAVAAGASRLVQANSYETLRRNYRRWGYGVRWIRQDLPPRSEQGGAPPPARAQQALGRLFLWLSARVTPDDRALDADVQARSDASREDAGRVRAICRQTLRPAVKRASVLATNHETLAIFGAMLAGSPLYLFLYILVVMNAAYVASFLDQKACIAAVRERLGAL